MRTLLVDVMGTLVHEPFYREIPAFFGMSLAELLHEKNPTIWIDFEKGLVDEKTYLDNFFRDRRAYDHAAFVAHVERAYHWLDGMEDILADLRATGHAMHALSNYPIWYERIEERLRLSRYLEWSFVSCITGVRKPDEEAFRGPVRALGVPAEACLFIDDREENCLAAQRVGMDAVLFETAEGLREELERRALVSRG